MNSFYTIKINQSHTYDKNGKRVFFTRLQTSPLTITQIKSQDKDSYQAYQIAIESKKRINKAQAGHLKNLNIKPKFLREIKTENIEKSIGDTIKITDIFHIGDKIAVKSKSKGRGFAGVMKRWGFGGGPRTHGQSDRQRSPGSIGQGTTPGRVHKGKKMPGHFGNKYINTRGGKVINIDEEKNEIWITGSVPGPKGGLVEIIKIKEGKFIGLFAQEKKQDKKVENPKIEANPEEKSKEVSKQENKENKEDKKESEKTK